MSMLSLPKIAASFHEAWAELAKMPPAIARIFALLVLPLSLIPPVMIYLAGTGYGDAFAAGYGAKPWGHIASIFFAAEILTFAGMGWLIRQIAITHGTDIGYRNAYLLAAIVPVPLWLSAFGLLVPSLAFNAAISIVALGMSCSLVYYGVSAFFRIREQVQAASITQSVFGAGLVAWAVLLLLIVLPA